MTRQAHLEPGTRKRAIYVVRIRVSPAPVRSLDRSKLLRQAVTQAPPLRVAKRTDSYDCTEQHNWGRPWARNGGGGIPEPNPLVQGNHRIEARL